MITRFFNWLDDRTGVREIVYEALYESVPGGARWRYVWGSTLVLAFMTQLVTGVFLWMAYSPSAQTAWESVFYIQFEMSGGWLLRGIHHYMAQLMVVLLALHLMQVVIDGAYKAPREINFWLGLILMKIVLGLSLTGYLLPWDQKGYWATRVATNLMGLVPVAGGELQRLVVGGPDYGHHTLTRFFAMHAGVLPGLLIFFLILHVALFRRHGLHAKNPHRAPAQTFWPDQILKDSVACLAVLAFVIGLTIWKGADLGSPADPASPYSAARPEWYFLFLFQFLKYFPGSAEIFGAIIIPGILAAVLFLIPIVGQWRWGHRFNVAFLFVVLIGAGYLTWEAWHDDNFAAWTEKPGEQQVAQESDENEGFVPDAEPSSDTNGSTRNPDMNESEKPDSKEVEKRKKMLDKWQASKDYLKAVDQAHFEAERVIELARSEVKIPPTGALTLLRNDAKIQGARLFEQKCLGCHNFARKGDGADRPELINEEPTAPNLYGFGTREWIAGILDPKQIKSVHYFGYQDSPFLGGDMVGWVSDTIGKVDEDEKAELEAQLEKVIAALSAEAALPGQTALDAKDAALIAEGQTMIKEEVGCTDCHKFHDVDYEGEGPDLTGYGSRQWLLDFVCNPAHERFYGDKNDRMPEFKRQLDEKSLGLIIDWLRGDWYEPEN